MNLIGSKVDVLKSQKEKELLELNVYTCTVSRWNPISVGWRCTQRQEERCTATVNITLGYLFTRIPTAHSHEPDTMEEQVRAVRNKLREAAMHATARSDAPFW